MTYRTLQVGEDKVSAALLARFVRKVKDGPVLAAELTVHNAQISLVRPPKDVGALGGVDINQFPPHWALGAVNGNLLLGIVDVLNVEDGIAGGEGRPLAQDPALGVDVARSGAQCLNHDRENLPAAAEMSPQVFEFAGQSPVGRPHTR